MEQRLIETLPCTSLHTSSRNDLSILSPCFGTGTMIGLAGLIAKAPSDVGGFDVVSL